MVLETKWKIVIFSLILFKVFLILFSPYLGGDYFFYLKSIRDTPIHEIKLEPLYFLIGKFLAFFIDESLIIRLLLISSLILLNIGTWLLLKKKFTEQTVPACLILLNIMPWLTISLDWCRFFLALSLFPFFILLYINKRYLYAGLLLSVMIWTHVVFIIFLALFLLDFKKFKDYKFILAIILVLIISLPLLNKLLSIDSISFVRTQLNSITIDFLISRIKDYFFYSSGFILFLIPALFLYKDKHEIFYKLFFGIFVSTFFLITYLDYLKIIVILSYILIFLVGLVINKRFKHGKFFNLLFTVFLVASLIISPIFTINRFSEAQPFYSEIEMYNWIRDNIPEEDIIYTTFREIFHLRYTTERDESNTIAFFFYNLENHNGDIKRYFLTKFFMGADLNALSTIRNMTSNNTYFLWTEIHSGLNYFRLRGLIDSGELDVIKRFGNTILAR